MEPNKNPLQPSISLVTENGTSIAEFSVFGGSVTNLSLFENNLIPRPSVADPPAVVFGSVLAPWPNRLEDGTFSFSGKTHRYGPLDPEQNVNHGLILRSALEYEVGDSEITFFHRFTAADFGFEIDLQFGYRLTKIGFEGWAKAKNLGASSAPFAIGFHPYFHIPGKAKLSASVTKAFVTNSRMLPVDTKEIQSLEVALPDTSKLDKGYFGENWRVMVEGEEFSFEITQRNLNHLMLYRPSPSLFVDGSEGIAIEPQSAPANAFNTELEKHLIQPSETKDFWFQIRMLG